MQISIFQHPGKNIPPPRLPLDLQQYCPSDSRISVKLNSDHVDTRCEHVGNKPMCTLNTREGILDVARPEKIWIDIHHYTDLTKRLKTAEKLNTYLASSGNLWKNEVTRLKKNPNDSLVNAECAPITCGLATHSTSASKNEKEKRQSNPSDFKMRRGRKRELTDGGVPYDLSALVLSFFDNSTQFAHSFVSQVCPAWWALLKVNDRCEPN